ncbi:MAG: hypothetical protein ACRC6O_13225 [Flavobacterium sp.]
MASMDPSGNITCTNNTTFVLNTVFYDENRNLIDLTGFTAKMQVKTSDGCSEGEEGCPKLILELSTENGRIVLGGAAGTVNFIVDEAVMSPISCGRYFYDCIIDTGSTKIDYFKGVKNFIIQGGITGE